MVDPVYIYIDFGNGQQYQDALDWHNNSAVIPDVRLGVRLACRGLCGGANSFVAELRLGGV